METRTKLLNTCRKIGLCTVPLAIVLVFRSLGWLQPFEWMAYDWFFQLRPLEPVDERIVIVGMDEKDIDRYGHPISDRDLARVLSKIKAGNPKVIGLDIVRDRPVGKGIAELNEVFATTPNLIGVEKVVGEKDDIIKPPDVLAKKKQIASVDVAVDSDGVLRRGFFAITRSKDGVKFNSLGTHLAALYLQKQGINSDPIPDVPDGAGTQVGSVSLYPLLPNDGGYRNLDVWDFQFLVNFRNPTQSFRKVSFSQVLTGEIEANLFKDKIVILGMTAISIKDEFYTPFSHSLNNPPKLIHGVEVQANFASDLLGAVLDSRPIIKVIPDAAEYVFIFFWGLGTAVAVWKVRRIKNYLVLFSIVFGIITILVITLYGGSFLAFLQGWWLPFVPSVLSIAGTSIFFSGLILWEKNQELERLQEEIIEERKQASLSTLASGIAHEIRNPLIHILNFTNLFFEYLEEIQEELEKIETNLIAKSHEKIENLIEVSKSNSKETITQIKRIQQISELLSSVARQDKNKSLLTSLSMVGISKPTPTNLNNLVDSILKIASYSRQFERDDFSIKIETNYDLTIGEKNIIVEDLTKIIINLVNNACDAVLEKKKTKGEEFQPTIGVSTRLLNEHLVEISVQDNGEGISPLIAKKIYEPFATTKIPGQGTGLGLYITYDLIKKNGGQIQWFVEAGRTKFNVTLPVQSVQL